MEAFKKIPELSQLFGAYPDANLLHNAAVDGGRDSRIAIARLWLSEGIPFAFKDCPDVYESMRTWLASQLVVNPKAISMTGSGRIGQSLHPGKFGRPFSANSDLDIFVISEVLFEKMAADAKLWCSDYKLGKVYPRNDNQRKYWPDNLVNVPININRGFVDSDKIPTYDDYIVFQKIGDIMWRLKEKLDVTEGAPNIKSASIRCYRKWNDCMRQISFSLPKK